MEYYQTSLSHSDVFPRVFDPRQQFRRRRPLLCRETVGHKGKGKGVHFRFVRCPVVFYRRYWLSIFNVSITVAAVGYDRITRAEEEEEAATELVKLQSSGEKKG